MLGKEKNLKPIRRKRSQNYRFSPQTIRQLELAARRLQISKTAYTELALQERFERDGVGEARPDFEAHFARYPSLVDGGAALQTLLKDREHSL